MQSRNVVAGGRRGRDERQDAELQTGRRQGAADDPMPTTSNRARLAQGGA
jgi:hypothetical protein